MVHGPPPIDEARLLATFLTLVRIDSPSGSEGACASWCAEALAEAGCTITYDDSAAITGSDVGNLIATLPGSIDATLVLSAHLDCVDPGEGVEPVVDGGVVRSAGPTILGADDKAGIAAAIECVRVLAASGAARPTVKCVFTVQEEVGLRGAKALDPETVSGDVCLVLDADGAPGGIVVAAPTHYTFAAEYVGVAAHAGVSPEKGLSAIAMAAAAISRLPIGRVDEVSTANVGTVEGGTATNVIAAKARVTGECRSIDRARVETLRERIDAVLTRAASDHGGTVDVHWNLEYEGFSLADDAPVVTLVRSACHDVGLEARTFVTGGGSDANVLAAAGVPTVALSCGMEGVHGTDERIEVAALEALARLCVAVAWRMGPAGG